MMSRSCDENAAYMSLPDGYTASFIGQHEEGTGSVCMDEEYT